jgi:FtsH-binding integral membrane protein
MAAESYAGPLVRRVDTQTLFAQTMGLVAVTSGFFTFGAYLGRNLSSGVGLVFFIPALLCIFALNFAVRRSQQLALGLLFGFGILIGLATAPTLAYYASTDPKVLWQAGGATALFIAGFGAAGWAIRRDLSAFARVFFWALVALIGFGIFLILF